MQEMQVWSLSQEDPREEEMAAHSSILAWEVPWTEEPVVLQSIGLQGVRQDWAHTPAQRESKMWVGRQTGKGVLGRGKRVYHGSVGQYMRSGRCEYSDVWAENAGGRQDKDVGGGPTWKALGAMPSCLSYTLGSGRLLKSFRLGKRQAWLAHQSWGMYAKNNPKSEGSRIFFFITGQVKTK